MHRRVPAEVLPPRTSLGDVIAHVAALGPGAVSLEDLRDLLGYLGARFAPFAAAQAGAAAACPVCFEGEGDLVRLPCHTGHGHWVCLSCLRRMWLRADALCPLCRRDHGNGKTAVSSLMLGEIAAQWVVRRSSLRALGAALPGRTLLLTDQAPPAPAARAFTEVRRLGKTSPRDLAGYDHVVLWTMDRKAVQRLRAGADAGVWSFFDD